MRCSTGGLAVFADGVVPGEISPILGSRVVSTRRRVDIGAGVRTGLGRVCGIRLGQRVCALGTILEVVARAVDVVVVVKGAGRVQQRAAALLIVVAGFVGMLRLALAGSRDAQGMGKVYRSVRVAVGVSPGSSWIGHDVQRSQAAGCGTGVVMGEGRGRLAVEGGADKTRREDGGPGWGCRGKSRGRAEAGLRWGSGAPLKGLGLAAGLATMAN